MNSANDVVSAYRLPIKPSTNYSRGWPENSVSQCYMKYVAVVSKRKWTSLPLATRRQGSLNWHLMVHNLQAVISLMKGWGMYESYTKTTMRRGTSQFFPFCLVPWAFTVSVHSWRRSKCYADWMVCLIMQFSWPHVTQYHYNTIHLKQQLVVLLFVLSQLGTKM